MWITEAIRSAQDEAAWYTSSLRSMTTSGHCNIRRVATTAFPHRTVVAIVLHRTLASAAARMRWTLWSQKGLGILVAANIGWNRGYRGHNALGEIAEGQLADLNETEEDESIL